MEQKRDLLAEKVNSIRLSRAEQEPQVKEVKEKNTILKQQLRELKKTQETITGEVENLKKEKAEFQERIVKILLILVKYQFIILKCKTRM